MKNIMIDIEGLGVLPTTPIVTIGAVEFDYFEKKLGAEMYVRVDLASNIAARMKMEPDTVKWWLGQPDNIRDELLKPGIPLSSALSTLAAFILAADAKPFIWANGITYDITILETAYRACGIKIPWAYFDTCDYRTIRTLQKEFNKTKGIKDWSDLPRDEASKHNALDDAKYQALNLIHILDL